MEYFEKHNVHFPSTRYALGVNMARHEAIVDENGELNNIGRIKIKHNQVCKNPKCLEGREEDGFVEIEDIKDYNLKTELLKKRHLKNQEEYNEELKLAKQSFERKNKNVLDNLIVK